MAECGRIVPALFLHINVLLAMFGGAALSTAARLKWDPSLYVPLREMWPSEYRVAACVMPLLGGWLLLLAHLTVCALHGDTAKRRTRFIAYVWLVGLFVWSWIAWWWWMALRMMAWSRSEQAAQLAEAAQLADHVQPILDTLSKWVPLPDNFKTLIQEVKEDAPRNAYVCACAVVLLALLLLGGAGLALCQVNQARLDADTSESEKRPLRSLRPGQLTGS